MSQFLNAVARRVQHSAQYDSHLFCRTDWDGSEISFVAVDDGWYLTLIAQQQLPLSDSQFYRIVDFLRSIEWKSNFFSVEPNEESREVRAVFRLPIFIENRIEDDVPVAVTSLVASWSILEPYFQRVAEGKESLEKLIDEATNDWILLDLK